ncbi:MAG TPA: ArsR family transcriptional regulator [Acidimicrobiales bacterium]|nr:ArsR family transcriptional regulator [Acidimicrobiales bacterium]
MRHDERDVKWLDSTSLQALAHPLRVRLVGRLRRGGPATASQLGRELGESSGATSYHLRALAQHGFVEEVTGRGTARERWWRASHRVTSWRPDHFTGDPDARAAEEWLSGFNARQVMTWMDEWQARRGTADPAWVAAAEQSDYMLRMTPERVRALVTEIDEVVERHRVAVPGDEPGAQTVRLILHALPDFDDDPLTIVGPGSVPPPAAGHLETETGADTEADIEPGAGSETEAGPEAEADANANADTDPENATGGEGASGGKDAPDGRAGR